MGKTAPELGVLNFSRQVSSRTKSPPPIWEPTATALRPCHPRPPPPSSLAALAGPPTRRTPRALPQELPRKPCVPAPAGRFARRAALPRGPLLPPRPLLPPLAAPARRRLLRRRGRHLGERPQHRPRVVADVAAPRPGPAAPGVRLPEVRQQLLPPAPQGPLPQLRPGHAVVAHRLQRLDLRVALRRAPGGVPDDEGLQARLVGAAVVRDVDAGEAIAAGLWRCAEGCATRALANALIAEGSAGTAGTAPGDVFYLNQIKKRGAVQ